MPQNNSVCTQMYEGDVQYRISPQAANGAITQGSGTVYVTKAGVCAMTIADPRAGRRDPSGGDDGQRLTVIAATAHAHTLSNAAGSGFNAGGTGSDVATFGGAIGDNITLLAIGGVWYVENATNVTLG